MRDLKKLKDSLHTLERALTATPKKGDESIYEAAITKLFEVCFEYAWKEMKNHLQDSGLEAYSPRDVIKVAAQSGLIEDPKQWLKFLEERNLSVHDYIGVDDQDYLSSIRLFAKELKRLIPKFK